MKAAYLLGVRPVALGADLHSETLSQRKRAMDWLYRGSRVPFFPPGRGFKDGEVLFDYCNRFGFEGVVSKRRQTGYASGASRWWVKVKGPHWKRANSERWRVFEKPDAR